MNPEAKILMDKINRLMQQGIPRNDPTIKTLEGLIADALAKESGPAPDPSGRNLDFMNPQRRPIEGMSPTTPSGSEIGRPTYKSEPSARPYTEADREYDRRLDAIEMDMTDQYHMLEQFRANPNPEGYHDPAASRRGGTRPFETQAATGGPDLPSDQDVEELENYPSDGMIQDFMNQFGLERLTNPSGPPPGYIPEPRPRRPDMQEGVMGPYSKDLLNEDLPGNTRASDFMRRMRDPMTTEQDLDFIYEALAPGEADQVPKRGEYEDEEDRIYPRLP